MCLLFNLCQSTSMRCGNDWWKRCLQLSLTKTSHIPRPHFNHHCVFRQGSLFAQVIDFQHTSCSGENTIKSLRDTLLMKILMDENYSRFWEMILQNDVHWPSGGKVSSQVPRGISNHYGITSWHTHTHTHTWHKMTIKIFLVTARTCFLHRSYR
jgi:hypothetical protein